MPATTARTAAVAAGRALLAAELCGDPDLADLLSRYDRWADDLWDGLVPVYPNPAGVLPQVV